MTNIDKYDIMIQRIEKEWYTLNQTKRKANNLEIPKYSKSQINKAGKLLSNPNITKEDRDFALPILNNWRSSHAYPLQTIANKLRRDNPNALVVQRLKRLESIIGKLQRYPTMQLYKMQDLGGCRVIVNSIGEIYKSLNNYKHSSVRHILKRENDYIQNPKESGYRGYHAIYQYQSDKTETYNKNMFIEIQFRTELQHLWATAVEMMGIYTKTSLKSSIGDKDILRYFTLVSSIFAKTEETPVCPNTSDNLQELITEIKIIDKKHKITPKLSALSTAVNYMEQGKSSSKVGYYILILDYQEFKLSIQHYTPSKLDIANLIYNQIEKENNPNIDAVLVAARSFDAVRMAYPNYFTDISDFINTLREICDPIENINLS